MPTYNMSASDFASKSREATIDFMNFSEKLFLRMGQVNKKFSTMRETVRVRKGVVLEKPLYGLPVIVSDGICVKDFKTNAGSLLLKNYQPKYDAHIISMLRESHATFAGMANQDELGICALGTSSDYSNAKNPHDISKSAGCCGGVTASVSAIGMPVIGISNSICGGACSTAWCRTYSYLPRNLNRHGMIEASGTLERAAIHARSAADLEFFVNATMNMNIQNIGLKNKTVAVLNSDNENKDFWNVIENLEKQGAIVKKVNVDFKGMGDVWSNIALTEAANNAAVYAAGGYGTKKKVRKVSTLTGSKNKYSKDLLLRSEISKKMEKLSKTYDLIVTPAVAQRALAMNDAKKMNMKNIAALHSPALAQLMSGLSIAIAPVDGCGISFASQDESLLFSAMKNLT